MLLAASCALADRASEPQGCLQLLRHQLSCCLTAAIMLLLVDEVGALKVHHHNAARRPSHKVLQAKEGSCER
jgi:hypothetical protein